MFRNKKTLFSFITAAAVGLFLYSPVFAEKPVPSNGFANGDGSVNHPYIIESPEQLEFLAQSTNSGNDYLHQHIKLKCDLDFTNYAGDNNHTPIGTGLHPFRGSFNGGCRTIKGIRINNPNSDYQSVFGLIEADEALPISIRGIHVVDGEIRGRNYVGGVIGSIDSYSWSGSEIMELTNRCNIFGDFNIGGVIGCASGNVHVGYIKNTGDIKSSDKDCTGNMVGGLVGCIKVNRRTKFNNLKNRGNVKGTLFVGGIAGYIDSTSYLEINNALNFGDISGIGYVNTIAGLVNNSNGASVHMYNSSNQKKSMFLFKNDNNPLAMKS